MAPRRRTVDDSVIARAACELLIEQGVEAMTFAQVSKRCGLAPPTLVQRFGTRQGMLEAAAMVLRERVGAAFGTVPAHEPPLQRLRSALGELVGIQASAALLAGSVDLSAYALELRKQISYALAAAVEAGEVPRLDVAQLARSLQIGFAGAVSLALLERADVRAEVSNVLAAQLAEFI